MGLLHSIANLDRALLIAPRAEGHPDDCPDCGAAGFIRDLDWPHDRPIEDAVYRTRSCARCGETGGIWICHCGEEYPLPLYGDWNRWGCTRCGRE